MNRWHESVVVIGTLLVCQVTLWVTHPEIGVRDVDAYAYILGAYSLQDSGTYSWLDGEPISHWPPGYSALLSLFPTPIEAARLLNYFCVSVAAGFFYILLRQCGWGVTQALCWTVVMHLGFFQRLGTNVKPDILTYTVFLGATCAVEWRSPLPLMLSCFCYNGLVPIKSIAVVFSPAAVAELAIHLRLRLTWQNAVCVFLIFLSLGAGVMGLIWFNKHQVGLAIPSSHGIGDLPSFVHDVVSLPMSIGRIFLTSWYGTVKDPIGGILTLVQLGSAFFCFAGARFNGLGWPRFGRLGLIIVLLSLCLRLIRSFELGVRLIGYGVLLLLAAGLVPKPGQRFRWIGYALVTFAVLGTNACCTDQLGGNDSRYKQFAANAAAVLHWHRAVPSVVYSNSFHILDIHERIATTFVGRLEDMENLPDGCLYLHTTLACYDAISTPVVQFDFDPDVPSKSRWECIAQFQDAKLYRKLSSMDGQH